MMYTEESFQNILRWADGIDVVREGNLFELTAYKDDTTMSIRDASLEKAAYGLWNQVYWWILKQHAAEQSRSSFSDTQN